MKDPKVVKNKKSACKKRDSDILTKLAKHIESKGWKVLVIGGESIKQYPFESQYHYEYTVKFTGAKIK